MEVKKIDEDELSFILEFFSSRTTPDFYEEEMFNLFSEIIKNSQLKQLKRIVEVLSSILTTSFGNFRSERIEQKCVKVLVRGYNKII